jgi:hypothetical protein
MDLSSPHADYSKLLAALNKLHEDTIITIKGRMNAIAKFLYREISWEQLTDYWIESFTNEMPDGGKKIASEKKQITNVFRDVYEGIMEGHSHPYTFQQILANDACAEAFISFISDLKAVGGINVLRQLWVTDNRNELFPLGEFILQSTNKGLVNSAMNILIDGKAHEAAYALQKYGLNHRNERALTASQYLRLVFGPPKVNDMVTAEGRLNVHYENPGQFLSILEFADFLGGDSISKLLMKYSSDVRALLTSNVVHDSSKNEFINVICWAVREYGIEHPKVQLLCRLISETDGEDSGSDNSAIIEKYSKYKIRLGSPIQNIIQEYEADYILNSESLTCQKNGRCITPLGHHTIECKSFVRGYPSFDVFLSLPQMAQCKKLREMKVSTDTECGEIRDFLLARRALIEQGKQRPNLTFDVCHCESSSSNTKGVTIEEMKELEATFSEEGITFLWEGHPLPANPLPV